MSKRMPLLIVTAALLMVAMSATAQPPAVLKSVPSDFHVVVVAKSLDGLNQKVTMLFQQMDLDQPPDVVAELSKSTGIKLDQVDKTRAAVMMLPRIPTGEEDHPKAAVLLPVKDFNAFATDNNATTVGNDKVVKVRSGDSLILRQVGDYALLAATAEIVQQVLQPAKPLSDALNQQQMGLLTAADLWVHVNVGPAFEALRPMMDKQLREANQPQVRTLMELLRQFGQDSEALDMAGVLNQDGIQVRGLLVAKEGSDLAKTLGTVSKPNQPLVTNVPLENYLILIGRGAGADPDSPFARKNVDLLKKLMGESLNDPELAARLIDQRMRLEKLVKSASASLTASSKDGQLAPPLVLSVVAEVSDADAAQKLMRQYLTDLTKVKIPGREQPGPAMTFTDSAEEVAGVKVDRLSAKPGDLLPGMGPFAEMLAGVFGEQQLNFRVAFYKGKMVGTLGGGTAALEAAFKAVDANTNAATLAGIEKVKQHLVNEPNMVVYLSADRVAGLFIGMLAGMAETAPPQFPKVDEPVTLSAAVQGRAIEFRMFAPMGLLKAGAQFMQNLRVRPAAPQGT